MTLTLSQLTATCILGTAQSGLTLALSKDHKVLLELQAQLALPEPRDQLAQLAHKEHRDYKALLARPALLVLPDLQAHKAQQAQRELLA